MVEEMRDLGNACASPQAKYNNLVFRSGAGALEAWDVLPSRFSGSAADSKHVEVLVTALGGKGAVSWNEWRAKHPSL